MSASHNDIGELAEIADLSFKRLVSNIYDELTEETRDLVDQWSKEGIASTQRFIEKVANRVLTKFKSVEAAFEEAYVLPIERARMSEATISWILPKIQEVLDSEVVRAQAITSDLCASFAAPPQQYGMYGTRLQGEGRLMAQRLAERVRLSILRTRQLQRQLSNRPSVSRLTADLTKRERDDLLPLLRRKAFDSDLVLAAGTATGADPVSLLMIDIDHFKNVNDTHGHPVGDEVLIGCATIVDRRSVNKGDAYRYGGEEIVVLLRNFTTAEALALADTIRSGVENTPMSSKQLSVTVSIGVATFPDHATGPQELLKAADRAMYSAKTLGRNRVRSAGEPTSPLVPQQLSPTLDNEQINNLLASVDLKSTLEQANGQHVEIKIENRSDVDVQITKIVLMYKGVRAAEDRVETSERGRIGRRRQKLIAWVDTPGLAQAMREIGGEFNREFDDFIDIRLQIEALGRLKDLQPQKIKVKVELGGRRVWQIR